MVSTAAAVTIVSQLKETSSLEHAIVTLQCELSKSNQKGTWLKNGKEIEPDDRHQITVNGTIQLLTIKDTNLAEDDAEYTLRIGDNSTTAHLHIEGELLI